MECATGPVHANIGRGHSRLPPLLEVPNSLQLHEHVHGDIRLVPTTMHARAHNAGIMPATSSASNMATVSGKAADSSSSPCGNTPGADLEPVYRAELSHSQDNVDDLFVDITPYLARFAESSGADDVSHIWVRDPSRFLLEGWLPANVSILHGQLAAAKAGAEVYERDGFLF